MKTFAFIMAAAAIPILAQHDEIAVTFDDLPCVHCGSLPGMEEVNRLLLRTLKAFKVPAIGFVNEGKLVTDGKPDPRKVDILRLWLVSGMELGNHTYSHISPDRATIEEYEADLLRGEAVIRPLLKRFGKCLRYFRHPQLRTGPTPQARAQLDRVLARHRYQPAPVTMDNDDFVYAHCYKEAKARQDREAMKAIADDYLLYMRRIFVYYKDLSREFLGRNVSHVLLLHANELNADRLAALLGILVQRGYRFVSLAEALEDPAYRLPEACSTKGISWLHRWMLAKGLPVPAPPDMSENARLLFERGKKLELEKKLCRQ